VIPEDPEIDRLKYAVNEPEEPGNGKYRNDSRDKDKESCDELSFERDPDRHCCHMISIACPRSGQTASAHTPLLIDLFGDIIRDIEVGIYILDIVVVFKSVYEPHHLLRSLRVEDDIGLRQHGDFG